MNMSLEIEPEARLDCVVAEVAEARRCGNTELAKKILRYARGLTPHTVEDELALGFVNVEMGDLNAALRWFAHVVALRPTLAAAHSGQALTLQLLQQPVEALNALMRALALDPRDLIAPWAAAPPHQSQHVHVSGRPAHLRTHPRDQPGRRRCHCDAAAARRPDE